MLEFQYAAFEKESSGNFMRARVSLYFDLVSSKVRAVSKMIYIYPVKKHKLLGNNSNQFYKTVELGIASLVGFHNVKGSETVRHARQTLKICENMRGT